MVPLRVFSAFGDSQVFGLFYKASQFFSGKYPAEEIWHKQRKKYLGYNETPTKGTEMFIFTDEERTALDKLVADLRTTAENLENVAYLKDVTYGASLLPHAETILAGYRRVLQLKERDLFAIQQAHRART